MENLNKMDVLFIGAGPASLAGAIKLKQLLNLTKRNQSVVVIDKAAKIGQHNLSGAIFEAEVLNELILDWPEAEDEFIKKMLKNEVARDELIFLTNKTSIKVPEALVPPAMHHIGQYIISVDQLVEWLAGMAMEVGVEIYTGFAGKEVVVEDNFVKGTKLGDKGLDKDQKAQSNYSPGEILEAKVTVFGDGSLGVLSEQLIQKFNLRVGRNLPVYSIGVKEIIRLPKENNFGANRVVHTIGFPNKVDVFGGGMIYSLGSLGENLVAIGLILGLDWRYSDLNPQRELQLLKSHPFVKKLIEGGEVIAYGAKTIPEGGYYSIPELITNGAILIGDAANLVNMKKIKGLHYAIKSGVLAAKTIFEAIKRKDFSRQTLELYKEMLKESFIFKDLEEARNYRQIFSQRIGLYGGMALSSVQQWLPRLRMEEDYKAMDRSKLKRQPTNGIDKMTAVNLSGTSHREDQPSHVTILDPEKCRACGEKYNHPCQSFCPAEVYRFEEEELILSPSNCLHDQSCTIKCPFQNIKWDPPEGGDGPKFKNM